MLVSGRVTSLKWECEVFCCWKNPLQTCWTLKTHRRVWGVTWRNLQQIWVNLLDVFGLKFGMKPIASTRWTRRCWKFSEMPLPGNLKNHKGRFMQNFLVDPSQELPSSDDTYKHLTGCRIGRNLFWLVLSDKEMSEGWNEQLAGGWALYLRLIFRLGEWYIMA